MKKNLKESYEKACNDYVIAFCKKHDLDIPEWCSEVDGTYNIADWYFYFGDIKTDIDLSVEGGLIFKWYDEAMEHYYKNPAENISYVNYIAGARFSMFNPQQEIIKEI